MTAIASPPIGDSLVETDERIEARRSPFYASKAWIVWILESLMPPIEAALTAVLVNQEYTDQHASISLTALPVGVLPAGVYEVWYYARVTVADGVSSSLQVTLGWTESGGGGSQSLSGAAMTADSTTVPQIGAIRVAIAPNSALTFSTTYASNTPDKMRYKLQFSISKVGNL